MKKPPSRVAYDRPKITFFSIGPAAQIAQKQKSRTTKSPLMQDWVFRLGAKLEKNRKWSRALVTFGSFQGSLDKGGMISEDICNLAPSPQKLTK